MENPKQELPVIEQIFVKFFENLKASPVLDATIINNLKGIHEKGNLADPAALDGFCVWLQEYNAKNKNTES